MFCCCWPCRAAAWSGLAPQGTIEYTYMNAGMAGPITKMVGPGDVTYTAKGDLHKARGPYLLFLLNDASQCRQVLHHVACRATLHEVREP